MFFPVKPSQMVVRQFLEDRKQDRFSYAEVGSSRLTAPKNYNIDHNRLQIGNNLEDFQRAAKAVKSWKMFEMPWVELYPPETPIEIGETVGILIKHYGFWSLNANRIVYLIEEQGEIEKYGFAYGTLTAHAEQGEERFTVEFHHSTGEVWYDLFAFSKPGHILAKLGYPLSRRLQKKFAVESKEAMRRAVEAGSRKP